MSMSNAHAQMGVPWWNKVIVYWHENHVTISFHAPIALPTDAGDPERFQQTIEKIIHSLHIDNLNEFLNMRGFNLKPLDTEKDLPRPLSVQPGGEMPATKRANGIAGMAYDVLVAQQGSLGSEFDVMRHGRTKSTADGMSMPGTNKHAQLYELHDKFLFPAPGGGTNVIAFFTVERVKTMYSMPGGMSMGMSETDPTREIVDLLNSNLDKLKQDCHVPMIAAMPHWLNGGAPYGPGGCGTHGCPVIPPIPVEDASALYKLSLPDLPAIDKQQGENVTVFVLDALPTYQQLEKAEATINPAAGPVHNRLLHQIVSQSRTQNSEEPTVTFQYWQLPEAVEKDSPEQPVTGRDIYGRLVGFDMPDHGLFVAGLVRELAPRADIECIRILNDRAVGNTVTLLSALQSIAVRMLWGDLRERLVVINMSLVTTAAQEELPLVWFGENFGCQSTDLADTMRSTQMLRANLHRVMQSLVSMGAVLVAAAGNDSNVHQWNAPAMYGMNMPSRWGPRYPAAFPEVIAVGAVDKLGRATPYSNYPALFPNTNGIATYGGGLPTPVPPAPGECMTQASNIDGLIGIYSASTYPALAAEDCDASYPAPPEAHGWATWVGTSFATPIVSALAARVLQKVRASGLPRHLWSSQVQWALTTAAGQQELLGSTLPVQNDYDVSVLTVSQVSEEAVQAEQLVHATHSQETGRR